VTTRKIRRIYEQDKKRLGMRIMAGWQQYCVERFPPVSG